MPNASNRETVVGGAARAPGRLRRASSTTPRCARRSWPSRARARPSILGAADRRRPERAQVLRHRRRPRVRASRRSSRAPATPARTASSCSSTGTRGAAVGRAARRPARAAASCLRARRARHAPARGGHAALRQRARPRRATRPRPASAAWSSSTRPATSSAAPRSSRSTEAGPRTQLVGLTLRRPRIARHGYRSSKPDADGAVGVVTSGAPSPTLGMPDRDGLRAAGRRRGRYHGRDRHPRRAGRAQSRPAAVLQAFARLARGADVEVPDGLRYTDDHEWLRVEGDEGVDRHHRLRRGRAGRRRLRRAAGGRAQASSRRRRSA